MVSSNINRANPRLGARDWPTWPLRAALLVLFCGPPVAALFQATRVAPLDASGALAHDLLSRYICPTPAKSYVLLDFPMAVCARCWGATIGLWLAWLLARAPQAAGRTRAYFGAPWPLRMGLAALMLLLWTLEINGWAGAPRWVLLLNGANGGLWAGLFLFSLWPGLRRAGAASL